MKKIPFIQLPLALRAVMLWCFVVMFLLSLLVVEDCDTYLLLCLITADLWLLGIIYIITFNVPKEDLDKITGLNLCNKIYKKLFNTNE